MHNQLRRDHTNAWVAQYRENEELQQDHEALQRDYREIRTEHDQLRRDREHDLKLVTDHNAALQRDHDQLKRDHDELKRDHGELKHDFDELKQKCDELDARDHNNQLLREHAELKHSFADLKNSFDELNASTTAAQTQLSVRADQLERNMTQFQQVEWDLQQAMCNLPRGMGGSHHTHDQRRGAGTQ